MSQKRLVELQALGVNTWNELVRKYIPDATDELCEKVLWEFTEFPGGELKFIEKQIQEYADCNWNTEDDDEDNVE